MSITLSPTTDRRVWDGLADSLSEQPDYHRWDWLDLHATMRGIVIERLLVMQDERPIGVFPVPRHSARSATGVVLPFPYLGPLVSGALLSETVRAYRRWQRRHGLVLGRFELTPPASTRSPGVLESAGCRTLRMQTVVVDLSHGSATELRRNYSAARRKAVNRARRNGVVIREAEPGEVTRLLPAVLDDIFEARDRRPPYPPQLGAEVEAWMIGRDHIAAFVAEVEGEPVGLQIALGAGAIALDWIGGCFRAVHHLHANALLYDRVLEWALETGHRAMDLCGEVDAGVLEFKLRFGGEARGYTGAESSVLPRVLLSGAQAARRALGRAR